MKIFFLVAFLFIRFQSFTQVKGVIGDSSINPIMVSSLDTTKFNYEINKSGCKTYYSSDSLGKKTYYIIGYTSYFEEGSYAWSDFLTNTINFKAVQRKLKKIGIPNGPFYQIAEFEFMVLRDGSIANIRMLNEVYPPIEEEVKRVIQLSPNWIPSKECGIFVKSRKKQRIVFSFDN